MSQMMLIHYNEMDQDQVRGGLSRDLIFVGSQVLTIFQVCRGCKQTMPILHFEMAGQSTDAPFLPLAAI